MITRSAAVYWPFIASRAVNEYRPRKHRQRRLTRSCARISEEGEGDRVGSIYVLTLAFILVVYFATLMMKRVIGTPLRVGRLTR